jgi:large subunit ribosomal protein L18
MNTLQRLQAQRIARKVRVRRKVRGTTERPRLSVYRSNKHTYVQIIDDTLGKTVTAASEKELKNTKSTKTARAITLGELLAQKAKKSKITKLCFDRGGYKYHGRIKSLLEAVRQQGIEV